MEKLKKIPSFPPGSRYPQRIPKKHFFKGWPQPFRIISIVTCCINGTQEVVADLAAFFHWLGRFLWPRLLLPLVTDSFQGHGPLILDIHVPNKTMKFHLDVAKVCNGLSHHSKALIFSIKTIFHNFTFNAEGK